MIEDKLKPCPFCGEAEIEVERVGTARHSCVVACTRCGARIESGETGFGDSWNTRAQSQEPSGDSDRAADPTLTDYSWSFPMEPSPAQGELVRDSSPIVKALWEMKEASTSGEDRATLYNAIVAIKTQDEINSYQKARLKALSGVTISRECAEYAAECMASEERRMRQMAVALLRDGVPDAISKKFSLATELQQALGAGK